MKYISLLKVLSLFLTLAFFNGCTKKDGSLEVGTHQWIGYDTLYIAKDSNFLPANVTLHKEKESLQRIQDLKNGTIQAGTFTLDEVILARSLGIPLEVVMIFNISLGGDTVISCNKIEKLSNIRGKRIAYEDTTISKIVLFKLLEAAGVDENEISSVLIPMASQKQVFKNEKADIFITYEPVSTQLLSLGGYKIFDSRQMPNIIVDVLAVNKNYIRGKKDTLKKLINEHFNVLKNMKINYDDFIYRLAYYEKTNYEDTKKALNGIHLPSLDENWKLLKNQKKLQKTLEELNQILLEQKIIKEKANIDDIFTTAYLPEEKE